MEGVKNATEDDNPQMIRGGIVNKKTTGDISVESIMKSLGMDKYQIIAQFYPSILTVLPALLTVLFWLPAEAKLLTSLISAGTTAGLAYLLMQYGRARGRAVQARMTEQNGGLESTIALRHRDNHIAGPSCDRYRAFLRGHGLHIPTSEEEKADPAKADGYYRAAADWLRERTRDAKKFGLLHGENRSYGFRRNLRGLRPLGATIAVLSLAGTMLGIWLQVGAEHQNLTAYVLAVLQGCGILAWLFVITDAFVEDASWAYTARLFAACDTLPKAKARTKMSAVPDVF